MDARRTSGLSLLALFASSLFVAVAVLIVADEVATAKTIVTLGRLPHGRVRHTHKSASYPVAPPSRVSMPASAGPCVGLLDVPNQGNIAQVEAATLCLVNAVRGHYGIPPLAENPALAAAALKHSRDMVANDYFDHTSPSGTTQLDLIRSSGYLTGAGTWTVGENLGFGTQELTTPVAMVIAWFFSPEHRANMLRTDYRETGIGVVAAAPASQTTDSLAATYSEEFGSASS